MSGGRGADGAGEALRIEDLRKSFGDLEVLGGVSLSVRRGEVVVVIGASGSGKSTMLRCVNFMEIPTSGKIFLGGALVGRERGGGIEYREKELTRLRARVGMVFQHFNLFPHMTVLQNVMEGPKTVLGCDGEECRRRGNLYLDRVGLAWKAESYPSQLSGGQQQRVAIARALAMEPEIMLFDEATSALDPELVGEVLETMKALAEDGMTMIIVTHELGFAYTVADRVLFLSGGRVLEEGTPSEVLTFPREEGTRNFLRGHGTFRLPEPRLD
ncbi:MAG: amino acid ABC transporter ATP-binding protein [Alphaproteobacteria bacterium]|nr:amino acid ABC transporter ATP-binding protein [Alphaproteobacteria bacterium]MDA8001716.1 amino acid ABC transporter ATP-binding protein [Alphaproteobacteria bacterium]MDA8004602.1 amino acid ABC transporter ATP-binding protein [Alphaproteobacteria bacterium]MDA8006436.1 amino acid ABC transporter ATP-binding protein [Alphaproteobacteria bacterium]MDA8010200.1 amino acid ABC transporter ATP-binding protein [Alphaproteobacteria bacterium]